MFLTATNLFAYLNDLGLASPADIVGEDFRVIEVGRRNRNFLVRRSRQPGLFIKQVPMFHLETISSFIREAACMRMVKDARRKPVMHALCPQMLFYDETRHVLIYELFTQGEALTSLIARDPEALHAVLHQVAVSIAAVHQETSSNGSLSEIGPGFTGAPPWVLSIGENAESVLPNMSHAQRQIVDLIRRSKALRHGLFTLHKEWRHRCLVHGDLKWDNIMLLRHDDARELRLIDWELADVGEPLWDLAQLVGSVLQYWVLNVPANRIDEHFSQPLGQSSLKLGSLAPVFDDLLCTYFENTQGLHPAGNVSLELTLRLVGARLVLLAFELHPKGDSIGGHAKLALRLAEYFLLDPVGAGRDLLGISATVEAKPEATMPVPQRARPQWEVRA